MAQVLVVDDSISVRKALERIFKPKGVEVFSADGAKAAFEILQDYRPTLIIADVVMPNVDGFEFCKKLKANPKLKSIPVMLISGIVTPETKAQARDVKAVGIVKKPFKPDTLIYIVDLIFNKLKTKDSAIAEKPSPQASSQPVSSSVQVDNGFDSAAIKEQLQRLQKEAALEVVWLLNDKGSILVNVGSLPMSDPTVLGMQAKVLRKIAMEINEKLALDNFQSILIEYGKKCLLVQNITPKYMLIGTLSEISAFSVARYVLRKQLPELNKSLS